LIAPVDTITPVPLLYHVHTFYKVRYNSPTTHPSQPTYTIKELPKKRRKKETKEDKQKGKKGTNTLTISDKVQHTHTNKNGGKLAEM